MKCSPSKQEDKGARRRPIQSRKANPPRDIMTSSSHRGFTGPVAGSPSDSKDSPLSPCQGRASGRAWWLCGPAEAASQAALTGLACCFQDRYQVRLRCPARWKGPWQAGMGKSVCPRLCKHRPPRSVPLTPTCFASSYEDIMQRPPLLAYHQQQPLAS